MKKRISLICLLAAVLAAVVFCALWQSAAQDRSALRALAQSGAAEAYALFSDFQEKGYDSDYWGGVAAFHAFQQAYTSLTDGTDKAARTARSAARSMAACSSRRSGRASICRKFWTPCACSPPMSRTKTHSCIWPS